MCEILDELFTVLRSRRAMLFFLDDASADIPVRKNHGGVDGSIRLTATFFNNFPNLSNDSVAICFFNIAHF